MDLLKFTEIELETIDAALDDYINYDDELLNDDELIGGLSVADRCNAIQNKIERYFTFENQITDNSNK